MAANYKNMVGGAAGRWFEPGEVYVLKDVTGQKRKGYKHNVQMYKIGYSKDPIRRLAAIQKELAPNKIQLLGSFPAFEGNGAETTAQYAAKILLGFVKDNGPGCRGNATDWFWNPRRRNHEDILGTIQLAVDYYNDA